MGGEKTGGVVSTYVVMFSDRVKSRVFVVFTICPSLSSVFNKTYSQSVSLLHNMPLQTAP